jgi:membrane-bound lytic murein transglycosylase D
MNEVGFNESHVSKNDISMQKVIMLLCIISLAFPGLAVTATAQQKQHFPPETAMIQPGSTKDSLTSGEANDTSAIQLSPVLLTSDETPGSTGQYNNLQPVADLNPNNLISGNLNNYVFNFIKNYYEDNTKNLQDLQSKSESYFTLIQKVFDRFGIPEELKYLAVIESGLNTNARSQVGAVGTWQLMAGTARLLGLQVGRHRDDRRDLYKSTIAAAKYLTRLHDKFDSWLLVVAAYNCGPGSVLKAIDQSGSTDFWDLKTYLPAESQKHVMKFLATAYIFDRFASFFGVDKSSIPINDFQPEPYKSSAVNMNNLAVLRISGKYSLPVIAKYVSMSINELNQLNPGFDQMMSSASNAYTLRLPPDKMIIFKGKKNDILNESVELLMENNRQISEANYPAVGKLPTSPKVNNKG